MSKKVEEKEPSEEELALLRSIKYDSQLQGGHPIIAYNVVQAVCVLLDHLKRQKLAKALSEL